jgi:lipid-A-disaccharide synthase
MPSSFFISAGEASGEHYGALLIAALRQQLASTGREATFFGMGGQRMAAAGLEVVVRSEDMAVMGLTEVIHHLPRIYGEFRKLKKAIRQCRPDVAVLIDFPEIHFRLAKELHRLGIPVIFFVSPQLWAWKKHRIKLVRNYVDKMLVIFPFEEPFYREQGVQAEFVGHPLAELPQPSISREQFAVDNGLDPARTWIGLLPGSRAREIRDILPEMLLAARNLPALKGHGFSRAVESPKANGASAPEGMRGFESGLPPGPKPNISSDEPAAKAIEFLIPLAPTLSAVQRDEVRRIVMEHGSGLEIRLVDDARAALFHSRVSVVASGTATVEAALIGNPFVVVYRVSPITYAIAKRIVTVPHVAMVNLIAGKRVVTELIQNEFTASNIVREVERLLPDGPPRQSMMQELGRIHGLLNSRQEASGGAIGRVAAITLQQIGLDSPMRLEQQVPSCEH